MAEPFRADHIGSLLRPPEMLEARKAFDEKQITIDALGAAADKAALQAIAVQKEAGIDVFTDGEYRRSWWAGAMFDSLEGMVPDETPSPLNRVGWWKGPSGGLATETLAEVTQGSWVVGARLKKVRSLVADEAAFLKQNAPGPWKVTFAAVSNRRTQWFKPGLTDQFYASPQALLDELVGFLNQEVMECIDLGCSYVQLDSLRYTSWMVPERRQAMIDEGVDLERELDDLIAADNASIAGARGRPGVTVGHHICRGNNRSAWSGEGGYEPVAEKLFSTMNVDRFLLEYDTARAGGFEPLRFVPADKMVVLGLISSKLPELESEDDLLRRIEEASRYVPVERLALSPQCGFASTMPGNLLTWEQQKRKLELVAKVARRVWG
jgi:5-methyltetrahydropteroyltriglutamate--homocysteine methyltransferase